MKQFIEPIQIRLPSGLLYWALANIAVPVFGTELQQALFAEKNFTYAILLFLFVQLANLVFLNVHRILFFSTIVLNFVGLLMAGQVSLFYALTGTASVVPSFF